MATGPRKVAILPFHKGYPSRPHDSRPLAPWSLVPQFLAPWSPSAGSVPDEYLLRVVGPLKMRAGSASYPLGGRRQSGHDATIFSSGGSLAYFYIFELLPCMARDLEGQHRLVGGAHLIGQSVFVPIFLETAAPR